MTIGRYASGRDEPFFWWGTPHPPNVLPTLSSFVAAGTIGPGEAALSQVLLRRGVSLFVISLASRAGKSSLLHALVNTASLTRQRIYLRGSYETFDFLETSAPGQSLLLVNEISPHLPAYLWGRPVAQLFAAMRAGFQVVGTAHAASPAEFLHAMTAPPLNVPASQVMGPMALLQLPGGAVHGIQPGPRLGSAIVENLFATVDPVSGVSRLLESAGLPSDGIEAEIDLHRSALG